jgi:ethanolamine utilization cobalamin adenosyltransferase
MGEQKKVLTEAMLRALCLPRGACVPVPAGTALTPLAREYAREHGLAITELAGESAEGMGKPEHMTHLNGSALVPKTHPRILLRGKLDSLEALLLQTQSLAREQGRGEAAQALGEVYALARRVLAAEVKGEPLGAFTLFGLGSAALRARSHDPKGFAGLDAHPMPHAGMGGLCLALNFLRTQVRETELAAAQAFCSPDGQVERPDLLEALNRMSSAVYLLFLKEIP